MILVTGATGFLGEFVVKELLDKNYDFCCFVRETSDVEMLKENDIELRYGDLDNLESIKEALEGVDTLVNIASLGFGHAPNIIDACEAMNVKRGIFISTTAIFTNLNAESKKVRTAAEETIKNSNLDYTILRPTMIYGTENDRNMFRLVKFLNKIPVMPIFGPGTYLLQPVYVKDLARVIVKTLAVDVSINNDYNIPGEKPLTYNQVIESTADALGKKVFKLHIPYKLSIFLMSVYEKVFPNPVLKAEQVERLNENKDFSIKKAKEELDYEAITFSEGIAREVNRAKKLGLI
jgi:nucleoside-diphosphate-sugar epimerase